MPAESNFMEPDTDAHRCPVLVQANARSSSGDMMVRYLTYKHMAHVFHQDRDALLMKNVEKSSP